MQEVSGSIPLVSTAQPIEKIVFSGFVKISMRTKFRLVTIW
jgi:hypothetical protein